MFSTCLLSFITAHLLTTFSGFLSRLLILSNLFYIRFTVCRQKERYYHHRYGYKYTYQQSGKRSGHRFGSERVPDRRGIAKQLERHKHICINRLCVEYSRHYRSGKHGKVNRNIQKKKALFPVKYYSEFVQTPYRLPNV